jgi:D-glycero-alpha-D-manno-heptose-7-phosphate kinase
MNGSAEIAGFAEEEGCAAFPLGAGGGGGVAVFAADPESLQSLRKELANAYRCIPLRVKERGHELVNLPLEAE